ncbi:MAG: 6-phosphogluconolactonase [Chloroflexi bacterium]|nr:6-phosphogluconolactonase [Chloroflexota bacterium]
MHGGAPAIHVARDAAELAERAAALLAEEITAAVAARGRCALALAGGGTPRPVYQRLAQSPYRERVPWPQVHVFWGDERCVLPDDPANNARMAHEALLAQVALPPANVHRVPVELGAPEAVAAAYDAELRAFFGETSPPRSPSPFAERGLGGEVVAPRFDIVLLGMGADGHTASLFPGSPALAEQERLAVAVYAAHLASWRVTLTLPVLNAAHTVVFLVAGADKAPALRAVLGGASDLPAAHVRPASGRLVWLVVAAAIGEG